jgi:hypothetical protein
LAASRASTPPPKSPGANPLEDPLTLQVRQYEFDECWHMPFLHVQTAIKKTRTAKHEMSNFEPWQAGSHFEIHHSLFDILRIKRLQRCGYWRAKAMKNLWIIVFIAASFGRVAGADQKTANLSGTWILDPTQSRTSQTTPNMPKMDIRISGTYSGSSSTDSTEKSPKLLPGLPINNLTLTIVQTGDDMQVVRESIVAGQKRTISQKFALDGGQCLNLASDGQGELESRTSWKKGKLINSGTETVTVTEQRTEISITEEYSISKNGKKLTIKTMQVTPQGVTTLKQVFTRPEKP